ncbi:nucleotide exchange factors-like protein [Crepidotus variabilis]|uniref:Nucleotide exchange factors-like protein n=1 Tax=Crepidotus variabilis TaxID=179855 RepID=A0A9P6ECI2_9AGAR|nr:nucleotide exchange factors-like protein [Crepidotus variabilis]
MQSILRWSIENSAQDGAPRQGPPAERKDLDSGVIDMILGKPDAVQMKEDMDIAVDLNKAEDERIEALDHLEMLIEHIDNANDLQKLGLWEPLHGLLTEESSTAGIKSQALWVIGTAVQNNPTAQDAYFSLDPLSLLLSFLAPYPASSQASRSKAIYALSALLKHNAPAVQLLSTLGLQGWPRLRDALKDPAIPVRRKIVFLLSSLLIPTSSATASSQRSPAPLLVGASTAAGGPNLHTSDTRPAALAEAPSSDPIHPNSHSANLKDPARSETSGLALEAFSAYGILESIITSIVNPLPHGDDGENTDADVDFEERAVRLLHTYAVICSGALSKEQKTSLKEWIQVQKKESGGEANLIERWCITKEEYAQLVGKLL